MMEEQPKEAPDKRMWAWASWTYALLCLAAVLFVAGQFAEVPALQIAAGVCAAPFVLALVVLLVM